MPMKDKDPKYEINNRNKKKIATRCRVCGGQLLIAEEIAKGIHSLCDNDDKNVYLM